MVTTGNDAVDDERCKLAEHLEDLADKFLLAAKDPKADLALMAATLKFVVDIIERRSYGSQKETAETKASDWEANGGARNKSTRLGPN